MSYKCGHPPVNILLNNDSGCISNVDRLLLAPVFQGRGTCQPRCQPVGWVSWYPQWTREACWAPCLWPGTTSDRKRERWGQKQERSEYTEKLVKRKKKKKSTEYHACVSLAVPGKWDLMAESYTRCLPAGRSARNQWSFRTWRSSVSPHWCRSIEGGDRQ